MDTIALVFGWIAQATLLSFCILVSPAPWQYKEILVAPFTDDECIGPVTPEASVDLFVRFVNPSAVAPETLRAVFSEAARIWRGGGVTLHDSRDASAGTERNPRASDLHGVSPFW